VTNENITQDPKSAAEVYRGMGWNSIPVKKRSKQTSLPRLAPYLERQATDEEFKTWEFPGVAVVTGPTSDIVVVDADGAEGVAVLEEHGHPVTPTARTPGGGLHLYFQHPGWDVPTAIRIAPGVDLKSSGGYVVAPPSKGSNGKDYEWAITPEEASPAPLPNWILEKVERSTQNKPAQKVEERIPKGKRSNELTSLAGSMRRRGMDEVEIYSGISAVNERRCDPPLPDEEVRKIARSISRYAPAQVAKVKVASPNGSGGHKQAAEPATQGAEEVGITKRLADAILEGEYFARDAGGKLYRYSDGTYKQYGERFIRRRVKELLETWDETKKWSSHRANEVVEYIRVDAPELWERPPLDEVNVLNGLLNVFTKNLRPHTPDFLSPVQLPVEFDQNVTCPEWDEFVAETFPEDAQELAFEIAADLMTPERSHQDAILLTGEGANGKSTFLGAVTAFVGSTNVSGLSLQKLEGDKFATARLIGKLANICPDLPSTHLAGTSMFKAVTGGDRVPAEYKYRESFEFSPYARLIFSANQVPRSEDASHAFFRRWTVCPFNRTFEEGEQIPRAELDRKLSNPKELSGVLNKALAVLPRVRERGFTLSQSMQEAWEEFRAMTDPVSVWLGKATVEYAEAIVPKSKLLDAYNHHCDERGHAGMTSKAFSQAVKRLRPNISDAQRTVGGKVVWCWIGLGLKSSDPDPPSGGGSNPPGQDPDASRGGSGAGSHHSRDSRDPSNCFLNDLTRGKEGEEGLEITNEENRVNHVNQVNEDTGVEAVRAYLKDPPEWLLDKAQAILAEHDKPPERRVNTLATAAAYHCLGDANRWREALEPVREMLSVRFPC
jgi:putative DNA primase/helicase